MDEEWIEEDYEGDLDQECKAGPIGQKTVAATKSKQEAEVVDDDWPCKQFETTLFKSKRMKLTGRSRITQTKMLIEKSKDQKSCRHS